MKNMSVDATRWAWMQKSLRPAQKLILLSLADRANEEHVCWPSYERLKEDTGLDQRTIKTALDDMCKAGFLARHYSDGRGYVYQLMGVDAREGTPPSKMQGTKMTPLKNDPPQKGTPTPLKNVGVPPSKMYPESKRESKKNLKENTCARKRKLPKSSFGEFGNVKLTDEEHSKLFVEHPDLAQEAINKLDAYIGSKGDKYKSHYMAMHSWVFRAVLEDRQKGVAPQGQRPLTLDDVLPERSARQ